MEKFPTNLDLEKWIENINTKIIQICKKLRWEVSDLELHPSQKKKVPTSDFFYNGANAVICLQAEPLPKQLPKPKEEAPLPVYSPQFYGLQPIQRIDQITEAEFVDDTNNPTWNNALPFTETEPDLRKIQYDQLIQRAKAIRDVRGAQYPQYQLEITLPDKPDDQPREKSRREILAEQRDYKRRRQSYRAKNVHITKRSPTQVSRDLIELLMKQLEPKHRGIKDKGLEVDRSRDLDLKENRRGEKRKERDSVKVRDRRVRDKRKSRDVEKDRGRDKDRERGSEKERTKERDDKEKVKERSRSRSRDRDKDRRRFESKRRRTHR